MTSTSSFNYQTLPKYRGGLIDQKNDWLNRHKCEFKGINHEKPKKTNKTLIQKKEMKDQSQQLVFMKEHQDRRTRL